MEVREILIANTRTQKRSKITTDATTLGELKAALDAAGVDYRGMTFTEGISKTQLLDDATQLPQNVMYKGNPTNNLVILLTNTKKNIASGAYDRPAAYAAVKENHLQDAVKHHFGRNFTQVPTEALWSFIENNADVKEEDEENLEVPETQEAIPDMTEKEVETESIPTTLESIFNLVVSLVDTGIFSREDVWQLSHSLKEVAGIMEAESSVKKEPVATFDGNITDDDIDDMIKDIL